MADKVTELASSSGAPTPPIQTPRTDASGVTSVGSTDLSEVGKLLGPIQEDLNDAAEAANYPSPPVNTPAFTPAHSVRSFKARPRSMSTLPGRLANLKVESVTDDVSSAGPMSERGEDDFDDDDDSDGAFKGHKLDAIDKERPASASAAIDSDDSDKTIKTSANFSIKSGVTEKNDWAEDTIDTVKHALAKLEQLAEDDANKDESGMTAKVFYHEHLMKCLKSKKRRFPVQAICFKEDLLEARKKTTEE